MTRRSGIATVLVVAVLAPPAVGRAQEATERGPPASAALPISAEEYDRAERLYDEGRFQEALAAYLDFQRRQPNPALFFDIGLIYGELGDCRKAVEAYDRFLAESDPDNEHRPRAKLLRDQLDPCVAKPASRAPAPPFLAATPDAPPPPSHARLMRTSGYTLLGIAVASALGTGVFAALAMKYDAEVSQLNGNYGPRAMELWAKGERANLMTVVLGVTSLATAASGAGLLIFGPSTKPRDPGAATTGSILIGLRWTGHF